MAAPTHVFPSPRAWHRGDPNTNIVLQLAEVSSDLMAATRMPELLSPLRTLELVEKFKQQYSVDFALPSLLRSKLGYYLFKSALECIDGGAHLLEFLEDVIAFRMAASPYSRHQTYVESAKQPVRKRWARLPCLLARLHACPPYFRLLFF
jgi:hypothetical protein